MIREAPVPVPERRNAHSVRAAEQIVIINVEWQDWRTSTCLSTGISVGQMARLD
jgi:hypothetical protein